MEWKGGASLGRRDIVNEIAVSRGDDFRPWSRRPRLAEMSGYGSVGFGVGHARLGIGGRFDASSRATVWQPRAEITLPLSEGAVVALSYARAARLFQIITDPQPEPTLAFYDFFLVAGDSGVPVPAVHHMSAALDARRGAWSVHVGAYVSRGSGIGELRPIVDQRDTSAFRFGDSRTAGLEVRVARRPRDPSRRSVALSYALAWSERRWDDGAWRPWVLDQRHRLRLLAEAPVTARWRVFALVEGRSAQPVTRVAEVFYRSRPPITGDTLPTRPGFVSYLYAPEGGSRGSGTLWADVGTRVRIDGPGRLRTQVGLSVTNLAFGPVAPLEPLPAGELCGGGPAPCSLPGVRYRRRFDLPAVPALTVRIEF